MFQGYSILNHIHWKITNSPMRSMSEGISMPLLVASPHVPKKVRDDFNRWFSKVNRQYKQLLCRYGVAESLIFIGRKIINKGAI